MWYKGISVALLSALWGCATTEDESFSGEDLDRYIDFCRTIAMEPCETEGIRTNVAWMVGSSQTTQEFKKDFSITYADARYLTFRAIEYCYLGGAHGSTRVTVGTFDRQTGERLKLADVVPLSQQAALKKQLHDEAVRQLGGEEELLNEVTVTENFCLEEDGLHFIYNQYDIACYAAGIIEVVIPKID